MLIDAHVHLERGPYELAWIRRFVGQAQTMGLGRLYLLEHSHCFREFAPVYDRVTTGDPAIDGYQRAWLSRKLDKSLGDYRRLIAEIRGKNWPLEIRCGLEVCYFPGAEEETRKVLAGFDGDFLTGSVHWVDGWGFDHPRNRNSWTNRDVGAVYRRYYEIMLNLLDAGLFDHLAHPESIKCFGHHPPYDLADTYQTIARAAKSAGIKVEYNNGLRVNYGREAPGLSPVFLRILLSEGVEILTASDAHRPEDVGRYIAETQEHILRRVRALT